MCTFSVGLLTAAEKNWLGHWDGIIFISANLYTDFGTRLLEVTGFSIKERTSLTSVTK